MTKQQPPPSLSDAQLEIMAIVWEQGEVSVADVWHQLAKRRQVARNTVQTMLVRLEEKGYLRHRRVGNAHVYTAVIERKSTVRGLLRSLLNGAFQGSTEGLVMALLEEAPPSPDEVKRIRKLLGQIPGKNSREK